MKVRPATLDDTAAISELHCAQIPVWQRLDENGRVQDVEREALSIYERWQHGGPWMSVETGALHLSHLLHGAGTPLVAEDEGVVVASAVLYEGHEPEPYGRHLSMEHPTVLPDRDGRQILNTMLAAARQQMKEHGVNRLLLPLVLPELQEEYASRGFSSAGAHHSREPAGARRPGFLSQQRLDRPGAAQDRRLVHADRSRGQRASAVGDAVAGDLGRA